MEPIYFATAAAFRAWLDQHHQKATELLLGLHKRESCRPGLTYPEALDEALCRGWIDGVRKNVNEGSYQVRFTPRKPRSYWSAVNIKKAEKLIEAGRMKPEGLAAFAKRGQSKPARYAFENAVRELDPESSRALEANSKAAAWFKSQPPSYQKTAAHWVLSAKKPETRARRLAQLIASSAKREFIPPLRWASTAPNRPKPAPGKPRKSR